MRIFGGIVAADSSGAVSAWEGTGSRLEGGSYVVVEYNRDNGGDDNADRACPQEAARRNGILGHKAILRSPLWHIYTTPLIGTSPAFCPFCLAATQTTAASPNRARSHVVESYLFHIANRLDKHDAIACIDAACQ